MKFSETQRLHLVHPGQSTLSKPVTVRYELSKESLNVDFDVACPVLFKKESYGPQDFPYMYDVVEVFVAVNDPGQKKITYFEYEITPLNQVYHLRLDIIDGKRHSSPLPPIEASAHVSPERWSASFKIPLDQIGWQGDPRHVRGNFFAILGNDPRTYWSAFLPPQKVADFHKPEHFKTFFGRANS